MKLYIVVIALLLVSCGARKVDIANIKIKKDSVSETTIKLVAETSIKKIDTTNINTQIEIDELILTPIDTSKPISVNNVLYKNVILSIKKTKSNILYTNIKKESEIKHIDSTATNKVSEETAVASSSKVIDKKQNYWVFILPILLLIILYLLWQNKTWLLKKLL
jgi:predicted RND superfamily exporter protein